MTPGGMGALSLRGMLPWLDRKGRVHPLRTAVFALLLLPGAWVLLRWAGGALGARPLNAAIHITGYWAAWLLLASLVVTPARAVLALPSLVVVRRMVGNAALAYAGVHLLLYAADQNWRLPVIVSEIFTRFYLTIGFAALVGLAVLGVTSTDGWARRLGRWWKRLHRLTYDLAILALFHFFLQSKQDVSAVLFATGVFLWLMLWRVLPAGWDRGAAPLLGLAVASAGLTLGVEYAWYAFATGRDPWRVVLAEFDVEFGLRPAGQVLALGLFVVLAVQLRAWSQTLFGARPAFTMLVYALGALADDALGFVFGTLLDDDAPGLGQRVLMDVSWAALFAALGLVRWRLRAGWQRFGVDALWAAAALYHAVLPGAPGRGPGVALAVAALGVAYLAACRAWAASRGAAARP